MSTILLLFILGIVMLALDLFMPGIVLSVFGTIAMLAGTALAFSLHGVAGGLLAFAIGAALLSLALYIEYGLLPKTKFGRKFFLHAEVHGTSSAKSSDAHAASSPHAARAPATASSPGTPDAATRLAPPVNAR